MSPKVAKLETRLQLICQNLGKPKFRNRNDECNVIIYVMSHES